MPPSLAQMHKWRAQHPTVVSDLPGKVNSAAGTVWNWMSDTPGIGAVPLGLAGRCGPCTQGSDKARDTRLVSPLGFDGAVPAGRMRISVARVELFHSGPIMRPPATGGRIPEGMYRGATTVAQGGCQASQL